MRQKNILLINGHPGDDSFSRAIANAYIEGAEKKGHTVTQLNIGEMDFDPILHQGYKEIQELEPALKEAQDLIANAQHLVFIFPVWWSGMPAKMKGFFDRLWLPGFAFKFHENGLLWDAQLKGRSARVILTMNMPYPLYKTYFGAPLEHSLGRGILKFSGIRPVHFSHIDMVEKASDGKRNAFLKAIHLIGKLGS